MKKFYGMILVYHWLSIGKNFTVKDIIDATNNTDRSCRRYIHDIKEYLKEFEPEKEIVYDRINHTFKMKTKKTK